MYQKEVSECRNVTVQKFDSTMKTSLVVDALRMAIANEHPAPGLIIHSDQGSQYCSHVFQEFFSAPGHQWLYERAWAMLGQRSGRIILGNPEAGNATIIRMLQQPKGGAGYCDSLDILLQWNSAPFTAGDAIPLSIQIKGANLVIRAFLSRFEIPRPRPSSTRTIVKILSYRKAYPSTQKASLPLRKEAHQPAGSCAW